MEKIKVGAHEIRLLQAKEIEDAVAALFTEANYTLTADVTDRIAEAERCETCPLAKNVLCRLLDNAAAAKEIRVPVCQDTGMAVLFLYIGEEVHILGSLEDAVQRGVARAYVDGKLRLSVVRDPLYARVNTGDNTPAVLHISIVPGDRVRLVAMPKGFGSENMSALKMMTPAATEDDVVSFVVDTVKTAGANPCPPITVGVGIGGDFELAARLAKESLARPLSDVHPDPRYAALEARLLSQINALGIGPQGFSGDTTALAVKVAATPTHIAGLPVAVNINCHVARHREMIL
ncbi:MAG: fumarate hydratase [Clostridia bacterium]|nr:fumarate hydratase [Clostridia bacterium]